MTSSHDLIKEGLRRAYRARPTASLAGAVGGQAGGSGDGSAVEIKTRPPAWPFVPPPVYRPPGQPRTWAIPVAQSGSWAGVIEQANRLRDDSRRMNEDFARALERFRR